MEGLPELAADADGRCCSDISTRPLRRWGIVTDSLHLQNLLIFENLVDLKRCYTFPIEVEVSEAGHGVSNVKTLTKACREKGTWC